MAHRQGATPPAWLGRSRLAPAAGCAGWLATERRQADPAGRSAAGLCPARAGAAPPGTFAGARTPGARRTRRCPRCRSCWWPPAIRWSSAPPRRPASSIAARASPGCSTTCAGSCPVRPRCWIRWGCSRRARPSSTTCCRPSTATRSTTWCCCAPTPAGWNRMEAQTAALLAGHHPHQRALSSLIEDGSYHARLPAEIAAFAANPLLPARPIPAGLLPDPGADAGAWTSSRTSRGFADYAARLRVGWPAAIGAWLAAGFDETVGGCAGDQARPAPGGAGRLRSPAGGAPPGLSGPRGRASCATHRRAQSATQANAAATAPVLDAGGAHVHLGLEGRCRCSPSRGSRCGTCPRRSPCSSSPCSDRRWTRSPARSPPCRSWRTPA